MRPELSARLMALADQCHALIACRVSPKQKHLIVSLVKKVKPKATVLAIGDGANDVHMLSSASVSVGIRGLEGQQAAKASDFAIGEFKILQRLLFYHGRENYRKNSFTILYSFYKNALPVIAIFWYGFLSLFSGVQIYEDLSYQAYNVLFSSFPIIIYAVYDAQYSDKELLDTPALYIQGIKGQLFNSNKFTEWFGIAILEAAVLTFISYYAFGFFGISQTTGMKTDYLGPGMMIYFCVVLIVNLRILNFSYTPNILLLLSLVLMVLLFFLTILGLSSVDRLPIAGIFTMLFGSSVFWAVSVLQVAFIHIVNVAQTRFKRLIDIINFRELKSRPLKQEEVVLEFEKPKHVLETKCLTSKDLSKAEEYKDSVLDTQELEMSIEKDIAAYSSAKKKYTGFAFSGPEMDPGLKNAQG